MPRSDIYGLAAHCLRRTVYEKDPDPQSKMLAPEYWMGYRALLIGRADKYCLFSGNCQKRIKWRRRSGRIRKGYAV